LGISKWVYFLVGCHDFRGKTVRIGGIDLGTGVAQRGSDLKT